MSFTTPPPAPQRGDRTTFSNRVDAFLTWLVSLIPQLEVFISSLTTLAAGGANTFSYTVRTGVGEGNPGPGGLRFGSYPQAQSNAIQVSYLDASNVDVSGFMNAMRVGTSNIKGSLRLQKLNDPSKWMLFDISSVTSASGYFNLVTVMRATSAPSLYVEPDTVMAFFEIRGDRGDGGNTPTQQQILDAVGILPVAKGGTGASNAPNARTNLGVPASSEVVKLNVANVSLGTMVKSAAVPAIAQIVAGATADQAALIISNDGNNFASAAIRYQLDGKHAVFMGLDTDMQMKIGGYSLGNNAYVIYHQGNLNPGAFARLDGAAFTGAISAPTVTETSDERKKTNWRALTDAQLDALADLEKVGVFDWLDGSGAAVGASAQAIRAIVPEAVHEDADGNLSVAYGGLSFAMAQSALRRQLQQRHVGRAKGSW